MSHSTRLVDPVFIRRKLFAASSLDAGHFEHPLMVFFAHFLAAPFKCTAHPG